MVNTSTIFVVLLYMLINQLLRVPSITTD